MAWCEANCVGTWRFSEPDGNSYDNYKISNLENTYLFMFDDERDYITFTLKFQ